MDAFYVVCTTIIYSILINSNLNNHEELCRLRIVINSVGHFRTRPGRKPFCNFTQPTNERIMYKMQIDPGTERDFIV
jgi:hypothetical protein